MPIETGETHGICTDCARRGFPDPNDLLIFRPVDLRVASRIEPGQRSPVASGSSTSASVTRFASSSDEVVRRARPLADEDADRKAWISGGPGLLELRTASGRAIRSVIYERSCPDSKTKARGMLVSEARVLGYTLVEESEDLLTGT
jgi:hypothetical protein